MKRSKKSLQQTTQLKLDTTTVKQLSNTDFAMVHGGNCCAIKTNTCRAVE